MTSKSIMQNDKSCYVCHARYPLHKHHIYGGGNRQVSDKEGFWVYLCFDHHTGTHGVHRVKYADTVLKRTCQAIFERDHSREEFMQLIGRNYLEEEGGQQ